MSSSFWILYIWIDSLEYGIIYQYDLEINKTRNLPNMALFNLFALLQTLSCFTYILDSLGV